MKSGKRRAGSSSEPLSPPHTCVGSKRKRGKAEDSRTARVDAAGPSGAPPSWSLDALPTELLTLVMSRLSVPDAFGLASVSRGFLAELHRLQKSGELVKSKRTAELIARGASPAAANKFEYVTRRN
eukprot:CAMPEP_0206172070 /NCGR_PEP_ID=MMETSP1474-20131121/44528_1 /ASSEMBLY_ACC=CAM_ASM_001110 /TAXON_ID=97495 /ORGANISM="Imantonia sp., Strain RCC918" /LENGTH=125 /DNA_ID=CAMNT_0053579993 /DNA_START=40 /DNA_END=414 /DNA_ORIENTATION=+